MTKKLETLTIDRKRWLRGEGSGDSYLLRGDSKMCCLGFLARQRGLGPKAIKNRATPPDVSEGFKFFEDLVELAEVGTGKFIYPNDACENLMRINDSREVNDEEREKELKKEFRKIGIKAVFV